jgi:uncharacterized protein with PQ loop repeat
VSKFKHWAEACLILKNFGDGKAFNNMVIYFNKNIVKFLLLFIVSIAVLTTVFQVLSFGFYGQIIGYLSVSIEATLGLPQLYSNFKTKSVEGLSFMMISTWFLGDFLKTIYYVMEHQPFQFTMCGAVQLTVDILIILQIIAYSKS